VIEGFSHGFAPGHPAMGDAASVDALGVALAMGCARALFAGAALHALAEIAGGETSGNRPVRTRMP